MALKQVLVVPRSDSGWTVQRKDSLVEGLCMKTRSEAVRFGRIVSQRTGGELVIFDHNGQVQWSDSGAHKIHVRKATESRV
ncbi:MAG: DUF2188 domain-containing protein [Treponematales bacterium]